VGEPEDRGPVKWSNKQGQGGKLIFISSVHEDISLSWDTRRTARPKGPFRMMIAQPWLWNSRPHKINVNNIAPGAIATPINESVLEDSGGD